MRLVSVKEYSEINFFSISSVRKSIKQKKLKAKKIKGRVFVWID